MARIGENAFRQYRDGQDRLTAPEYMAERELIRLAVNDLDDKIQRTEGIREEFSNTVNEVETVKGEVVQTKQEVETRIGEFSQTIDQTAQDIQNTKEEVHQVSGQIGSTPQGDAGGNNIWTDIEQRGVNLKWFGVEENVQKDQSQKIQSAINYCQNNGLDLHLMPGQVYYCADLKISKSLSIVGNGSKFVKNNPRKKLVTVDIPRTERKSKFTIEKLILDGNQTGDRAQFQDLHIINAVFVQIDESEFLNPQFCSLMTSTGNDFIRVRKCKFVNGLPTTGLAWQYETFHINLSSKSFDVDNNDFESDVVYSSSPYMKAPLGIVATNSSWATVRNNKGKAYHIDMYSNNNKAIITGNIIEEGHHGGIKVEECRNVTISNNQIINCLSDGFAGIHLQPWARADTYGSLSKDKGNIIVNGNVIDGAKDGGINIEGKLITQAVLERDSSLVQQDLTAKGIHVFGNTIKNTVGKRRGAINCAFADSPIIEHNVIEKYKWTETGFVYAMVNVTDSFGNAVINHNNLDNTAVSTNENITITGIAVFKGTSGSSDSRAIIKDNKIKNFATRGIDCRDLSYVKINENDITGQSSHYIHVLNTKEADIFNNTGFDQLYSSGKYLLTNVGILRTDLGRRRKREVYEYGIPTSGTWEKGDIRWNPEPAIGRPMGWVCVNNGTPGTWQSFGTIGHATSITAAPVSVGQIAIVGGVGYLAVGTTVTDWKQITT